MPFPNPSLTESKAVKQNGTSNQPPSPSIDDWRIGAIPDGISTEDVLSQAKISRTDGTWDEFASILKKDNKWDEGQIVSLQTEADSLNIKDRPEMYPSGIFTVNTPALDKQMLDLNKREENIKAEMTRREALSPDNPNYGVGPGTTLPQQLEEIEVARGQVMSNVYDELEEIAAKGQAYNGIFLDPDGGDNSRQALFYRAVEKMIRLDNPNVPPDKIKFTENGLIFNGERIDSNLVDSFITSPIRFLDVAGGAGSGALTARQSGKAFMRQGFKAGAKALGRFGAYGAGLSIFTGAVADYGDRTYIANQVKIFADEHYAAVSMKDDIVGGLLDNTFGAAVGHITTGVVGKKIADSLLKTALGKIKATPEEVIRVFEAQSKKSRETLLAEANLWAKTSLEDGVNTPMFLPNRKHFGPLIGDEKKALKAGKKQF